MQIQKTSGPEVQDYQSDEPDSLFGVCQAIGEDFGFNPFFLRVALLSLLFFSPVAVVGTYAALGAAVALSHSLFPRRNAEENPRIAVEPELLAA